MRTNELFLPIVFGYYIKSIQKYLISIAEGSTGQQSLRNIEFNNFYILVPPKKYQIELNGILEKNLDLIERNQRENQELIQLRDFLLPLLMNRQVKVK